MKRTLISVIIAYTLLRSIGVAQDPSDFIADLTPHPAFARFMREVDAEFNVAVYDANRKLLGTIPVKAHKSSNDQAFISQLELPYLDLINGLEARYNLSQEACQKLRFAVRYSVANQYRRVVSPRDKDLVGRISEVPTMWDLKSDSLFAKVLNSILTDDQKQDHEQYQVSQLLKALDAKLQLSPTEREGICAVLVDQRADVPFWHPRFAHLKIRDVQLDVISKALSPEQLTIFESFRKEFRN